ncbi:DUF3037 domain-containing protein [Ligilactobacillus agilis]|uniref:DUF3037 domain-containing protein n=1 Tax=Ligilactobacillus agilis TaxID=1601 RepID=UPI00195799EC|nr:DUF3037 domain-containing protein [Ligilactobacillus agilis]MBM6773486.1 DUF3037 domain-containing protein [Ligilactobacillus agilis]
MEKKSPTWYSIVSYSPNPIREEQLNVGVILGSEHNIEFKFLDSKNKKLSSLFWSNTEREEYKSSMSLLKYLIGNMLNYTVIPTPPSFNNGTWNKFFRINSLPFGIKISNSNYAMTDNLELLMDKLIDIYIGKQFTQKKADSNSLKYRVHNYFDHNRLLTNKIRKNIKVAPVKTIASMKIEMDYTYLYSSSSLPRFIQVVPNSSESALYNWYKSASMLSAKNQNFEKLHLIIENQTANDYANTTTQMIDDLKGSDKDRIDSILFDNETLALEKLTKSISLNGLDISNWKESKKLVI